MRILYKLNMGDKIQMSKKDYYKYKPTLYSRVLLLLRNISKKKEINYKEIEIDKHDYSIDCFYYSKADNTKYKSIGYGSSLTVNTDIEKTLEPSISYEGMK